MRNNGDPASSSSFAGLSSSIRCGLLPPNVSSSLMNSAETALAALGNLCRTGGGVGQQAVNNDNNNNNSVNNNNNDQEDLSVAQISVKMSQWSLANKVAAGKPAVNMRRSQNKTLLAQIARLQTELQMQAVRYQSAVAEFRRRLAYVSARQTHTPMAVERNYVLRLPLNVDHNDSPTEPTAGSVGAAVARKLGFSVLPDGTGLGGAIVTSVVNESIAYQAGLHIFDRICKVDGIDVCSSMATFVQLVDLLKGSGTNKQILTLEVARFEEPPSSNNKVFGYDDNASKENDQFHTCQCQQQQQQQQVKPPKVTVASVAVQTLPCLNPWFLADIRTNSTAVRTLRNGQPQQPPPQQQQQPAASVVQTTTKAPPPEIGNVSRGVGTVGNMLAPQQKPVASCPSIGISNFIPPTNIIAKVNVVPSLAKVAVPVRIDEEDQNWPIVEETDSAVNLTTDTTTTEEPTTTTLSSEKTWRTSSSSTTISLPNSQMADHKSTSSGKSFSSAKKESPIGELTQQMTTPDKASSNNNAQGVENFQSPVTMYTNNQHLAHTIRIQQHLFLQAQSSKPKDGLDGDQLNEESRCKNESLPDVNLAEDGVNNNLTNKRRPSSLPFVSCASSPVATTVAPNRQQHRQSVEVGDDVESWHDGSSNGDPIGSSKGRDASSADACRDFRWVVKVKSDGSRRIVKRPIANNNNAAACTPSSSQGYEEKTSNNSTPATHHRPRHKRQHHRKNRRNENNNNNDDDEEEDKKKETPDNKAHHHHQQQGNSNKRRAEAVLAVTTV